MNFNAFWNRAARLVADSVNAFCDARDAHHGTAWERLSVAYPDPREALKALALFRSTRAQLAPVAT